MITPPLLRAAWLLAGTAALALAHAQSAPPLAVPRFTHPGAGQIFYFVLTDRFANGRADNDRGGLAGDRDDHGFDPTRIGYFHGGDFAGLTAKLDYMKNLGATAVWVTPPFRNKPVQSGSAGYHGYWILDFLHVDPHLGTDAEFRAFVAQAHARGLKVYMDVVTNHTADVIRYRGERYDYVEQSVAPYRDAAGRPFDPRAVAYNGLEPAPAFPALSPERSFAYVPIVPPAEAQAKNPAWLNRPIYYHNRGNSRFVDANSLDGDFVGLDDLFTEHPDVVRGFIDIYRQWIEGFGVDGFRIDTVKHVNLEFWQAFAPAMRAAARRAGRPGFLQFGEVADETLDPPLLSEFSTAGLLDAVLDFPFFLGARRYVSESHSGAELADLFALDDYYTDHAGNAHAATTFLGNHDAGRFAYFLQRDNPDAPPAQLLDLVKLGHALLFLARGQPVLYYGDEQGLVGRGGGDMQARGDMFPSQAPEFRDAPLLGTARTGADDKFDEHHPLHRAFRELAALRRAHPALSRGAMLNRPTGEPALFAFSRVERSELVEYLAAFNNSRAATLTAHLPTSQPAGAELALLHASNSSQTAKLTADARGRVAATLAPLQFAVWRATAKLPPPATAPKLALTSPSPGAKLWLSSRELVGHTLLQRPEIRAEVTGGDGVAEVTFTMIRASRPHQSELLGVDDAPPYRVFWRPPPDLAPGETLTFVATLNDLRGHRVVAQVDGITVAPTAVSFGVRGATVPTIESAPPRTATLAAGQPLTLTVAAAGTPPLEYQWLRDDEEVPGATSATLSFAAAAERAGTYRALVRNRAGTTISPASDVGVSGARPSADRR